jgi:lysozyme
MPYPLVIDVSHYQGDIDFAAVAAAGVYGVIHKCTKGETYLDPTYAAHRLDAEAQRLLWGAYHFMKPGDQAAQARWFVEQARPAADTLLAADYEDLNLTLADLIWFLMEVESLSGIKPIIYSGSLIKGQMNGRDYPLLGRYRLWLAQYTSGEPTWPDGTWSDWWLWQYSDQGSIPGISGPVDLNAFGGPDLGLILGWSPPKSAPKSVSLAIEDWPDDAPLTISVNGVSWVPLK